MMSFVEVPGPNTAETPIWDSASLSSLRHDPSQHDYHVVHSLLAQQSHNFWEKLHVGTREYAQAEYRHVFLSGGLHYHPRRLTNTRVDDLHPGIS